MQSDGSLVRLESTCTVLGLFNEWDCAIRECNLGTGDTLAIYTDGITEACNIKEEEFGEDRLVACLRRYREMAPRDLLTAVVDEIKQFHPGEQYDDITLIVAKCRG